VTVEPQGSTPPPGRRSPLGWIREAPKLAGAVTAVVGSILAVLALTTWFFPWLSREPPSETSAEIAQVSRDPNVALRAYLAREGRPTDGYTPSALREAGNVFTVRLELKGLQGRSLPLRWSMFDADSRTALRAKAFDNRLGATLRPTRSVAEGERGAVRVWVPLPARSGSFFVRFDLYDGEGGLLDTRDGEPFPVTASRR